MPYNRDIFEYVPLEYAEYLESREMLTVEQAEFARLDATIDDLQAQFRVSTATWGLREWERICGLTTDANKTLGERRSNVLARLRGAGVVTIAMVKSVADGYYGGETEVISKASEYTIVIKFTSSYGLPSNLADLQAVLRELIPAHLAIDYEFKFKTYEIISGEYSSYDDLLARVATYDTLLNGG